MQKQHSSSQTEKIELERWRDLETGVVEDACCERRRPGRGLIWCDEGEAGACLRTARGKGSLVGLAAVVHRGGREGWSMEESTEL